MKPNLGWDSDVQFLKTVGPTRSRALERLGISTVGDLLTHLPRAWFDRTSTTPIRELKSGRAATVLGEIMTAGERRTRRGRTLQTVAVGDQGGIIFCQWFNQSYLLQKFRTGVKVMLSGTPQMHAGRLQMIHPDFEMVEPEKDMLHTGRLVPVYPLTRGVGQHWLRRLIHSTLEEMLGFLPENLPRDLIRSRGLRGRADALRGLHFPADTAERDDSLRRLVYEEILLIQMTMALRRGDQGAQPGITLAKPGDLTTRLVSGLPYELTGAQRRVLADILRDMRSGRVMHRLMQGDVGSGKTIVALIACLFAIEQGWRAMFMAPTEVLARQHGDVVANLVAGLGLQTATLTGSTAAAERRAILAAAASGGIDLLIGTHALIQDDVEMPRLGLTVVDEQHRFGVRQRGKAAVTGEKGTPPHVLVMSATPIPRSLALTLYGDLDLSLLDELPAGRRPIATDIVPDEKIDTLHAKIRERLRSGRQAYIVYPVIEETEGQDLKAAAAESEKLGAGEFKDFRTALLHGKLRPAEKQRIMKAFSDGDIDLLIATTVVEVGVDVPNSTTMVIHHPERFGLAQLHQLRGRVGRGEEQSYCHLVADRWLPPETFERIRFFAATNDGFELAEEDMRRRGPGDILGVRQHGTPMFRLANPLRDAELVRQCDEDARALLAADPRLESSANAPLRSALDGSFGRLLPWLDGG